MKTSARSAAFLVLLCSGCASFIRPAYVDPRIYSELDCGQLQSEWTKTNVWLGQVTGHETQTVLGDAGSAVLFGLPMPLAQPHPSEIASLKGRLIAIDTVATDKECNIKKEPQ